MRTSRSVRWVCGAAAFAVLTALASVANAQAAPPPATVQVEGVIAAMVSIPTASGAPGRLRLSIIQDSGAEMTIEACPRVRDTYKPGDFSLGDRIRATGRIDESSGLPLFESCSIQVVSYAAAQAPAPAPAYPYPYPTTMDYGAYPTYYPDYLSVGSWGWWPPFVSFFPFGFDRDDFFFHHRRFGFDRDRDRDFGRFHHFDGVSRFNHRTFGTFGSRGAGVIGTTPPTVLHGAGVTSPSTTMGRPHTLSPSIRFSTPNRTMSPVRSFGPVRSFAAPRTFAPARSFGPVHSFAPAWHGVMSRPSGSWHASGPRSFGGHAGGGHVGGMHR